MFRSFTYPILLTLLVCQFAFAQAIPDQSFTNYRPADTSSPRATLKTFVDSTNELYEALKTNKYYDKSSDDYRLLVSRILDCLDTSELPSFARDERAAEVTICIKEILDRVELPPWNDIPGEKEIIDVSGSYLITRYRIPGTRLSIMKMEEGPRKHEFLFSAGTVDRAVNYYHDLENLPYRKNGPKVSPDFYQGFISLPGHPWLGAMTSSLPDWCHSRVGNLPAWKWPVVIVAISLAIMLIVLFYWIHVRTNRVEGQPTLLRYWLSFIFPLLAIATPFGLKYFVRYVLMIRANPLYVLDFLAEVSVILTAIVAVFCLNNRIAASIIATPRIKPEGLDAQLIRIVSRLASIAIGTIFFLYGGQHLGIPLPTLLASAGVGGLAVALAAQDTLKNLFGTLMLMSDKPFRVGERIAFGQYDGIVEDVGLRSTRIRLLTGHLTTIPNDELARNDIENIGRRPHIRRVCDLYLSYDTSREKVEQVLEIIRHQLNDHEGMPADYPPRVYFMEFSEKGFQIRMIYWYSPPEYWKFLEFSERLNLEIYQQFQEADISLQVPMNVKLESHGVEQITDE